MVKSPIVGSLAKVACGAQRLVVGGIQEVAACPRRHDVVGDLGERTELAMHTVGVSTERVLLDELLGVG
jgi:hypothetical protein